MEKTPLKPTYRPSLTLAVLLVLVANSAARLHRSAFVDERDVNLKDVSEQRRGLSEATEATAADFPYLVSLRMSGLHFCGGALVKPDVVLTAASCVVRSGVLQHPQVRVGFPKDTDSSVSDEEFETCTTIIHSAFNERQLVLGYDVALLRLNASSVAEPVRLPLSKELTKDDELTLAGFRKLVPSQRTAEFRAENMEYLTRDECEAAWGIQLGAKPQSLVCAQSMGGLPPCNGDGGSPLLAADGTLVGIMSFGPEDCIIVEMPSASTRVSEFLSFIDQLGGEEGTRSQNPSCNA